MTHALLVIDVQNDFCPGGALPAIGTLDPAVLTFTAAMIAGIVIAKLVQTKTQPFRTTA